MLLDPSLPATLSCVSFEIFGSDFFLFLLRPMEKRKYLWADWPSYSKSLFVRQTSQLETFYPFNKRECNVLQKATGNVLLSQFGQIIDINNASSLIKLKSFQFIETNGGHFLRINFTSHNERKWIWYMIWLHILWAEIFWFTSLLFIECETLKIISRKYFIEVFGLLSMRSTALELALITHLQSKYSSYK